MKYKEILGGDGKVKNIRMLTLFANIFIFIVLMLFFKPVMKSDDYYMSSILYGLYSGEYDPHILYSNIIIGYLCIGLLKCFPHVAWFIVLQILFNFLSCNILFYIMKKIYKINTFVLMIVFFMIQYETIIKITFTKTSGLLLVAGIVCVYIYCTYNKKIYMFLGLVFSVVGMMYRATLMEYIPFLIIAVMFSSYKSFKYDNDKMKFVKTSILLLFSVILLFFTNEILSSVNAECYKNGEWQYYHYENAKKARLTDYSEDNYDTYEDEYKKISCSQNDLIMLKNNDLYYENMWDSEWIDNIIEISNRNEYSEDGIKDKWYSLVDFLKVMIKTYMNTYPLFVLLCVLQLLIIIIDKRNIFSILFLDGIFLAENFYLFINGRYFQRHVDFTLILVTLILSLILTQGNNRITFKVDEKTTCMMLVILLIVLSYNNISQKNYSDHGEKSCDAEYNKKIIEPILADKNHLYIGTSAESVFSIWKYDTFEIMERSEFNNVLFMGGLLWPPLRSVTYKFGVSDPLNEMVDSSKIRFFVSDEIEEETVNQFETYCKEHINSTAQFVKIEEWETMNVYVCISE